MVDQSQTQKLMTSRVEPRVIAKVCQVSGFTRLDCNIIISILIPAKLWGSQCRLRRTETKFGQSRIREFKIKEDWVLFQWKWKARVIKDSFTQ